MEPRGTAFLCRNCGGRVAPHQEFNGCPDHCSGFYDRNCVRRHLDNYHPGRPIPPHVAALTARGPPQDDSATIPAEQGQLRAELFRTQTRDPIARRGRQSDGGEGSARCLDAQGNQNRDAKRKKRGERGTCRTTSTSTSSPSSSASPSSRKARRHDPQELAEAARELYREHPGFRAWHLALRHDWMDLAAALEEIWERAREPSQDHIRAEQLLAAELFILEEQLLGTGGPHGP